MLDLTRRDFLRATSALAAALGSRQALGALAGPAPTTAPPVIWLQAQGCSGCSVSLLNSINEMSLVDLLTKTISLSYHSTLMPAYSAEAVNAASKVAAKPGYVLIVEGAIPLSGAFCELWSGLNAPTGIVNYAKNAGFIIAAGTCSAYGGLSAAKPNPTGARSLGAVVGTARTINLPGCPIHPDWLVLTVAYILKNGKAPPLDSLRRPTLVYGKRVHDQCPYREDDDRCLEDRGCKGKKTYGDCPVRRWNSGAAKTAGVNWCVASGSPCQGCTEPGFPDMMSPFYKEGDDDDSESSTRTKSTSSTSNNTVQVQSTSSTTTSSSTSQPTLTTAEQKRQAYEKMMADRRAAYQNRKKGTKDD